eukprot:3621856-Amphidinium_carterae.1
MLCDAVEHYVSHGLLSIYNSARVLKVDSLPQIGTGGSTATMIAWSGTMEWWNSACLCRPLQRLAEVFTLQS